MKAMVEYHACPARVKVKDEYHGPTPSGGFYLGSFERPQRKPKILSFLPGEAAKRLAVRTSTLLASHDPPRNMRFFLFSGPVGFIIGAFL